MGHTVTTNITSQNFWRTLPPQFTVLAPMDDVTDVVFRQVVAEVAPPEVFFTEFASADGWCSPGRGAVERKLLIEPNLSRPLVAQIWGGDPDHYYEMAKVLSSRGFAGLDINMGCPEKSICARGCCAGLIKSPDKASAIIRAVQAGTLDSGTPLPVSVKTRIGYNQIVTEEWTGFLLGHSLAALTVHGRTAREMSKVPAHWDEIARVVQLRNNLSLDTVIIGNGDVTSRTEAEARFSKSGVDGIMIGRGIFSNIHAFAFNPIDPAPSQQFNILLRHLELFEHQWGNVKSFHILRKFFKIYVSGFPGAVELRAHLMAADTADEVRGILANLAVLPMSGVVLPT